MSERVVAIHQPNYLPWIGYFDKLRRSDVFVLLDGVEYTDRTWTNRNRIKTPDGWSWLTVPVADSDGPIHQAQIATQRDWRQEHWKSFTHNYGAAEHFEEWETFLKETYHREWQRIDRLDWHITAEICDRVGISYDLVRDSSFDLEADGAERLAMLSEAVNADTYLCGMGADDYMEESPFEERGIDIVYQSFEHPEYEQRFDGFESNLTFLDACLNLGLDGAHELLKNL